MVFMIILGLSTAIRLAFLIIATTTVIKLTVVAKWHFNFLCFFFSCSVRVSNELGADRPHAARMAVRVAAALALAEGLIVGLVIIMVRNVWGKVYSNEKEVVRHVAALMPLLALGHLVDGFQSVLSGTTFLILLFRYEQCYWYIPKLVYILHPLYIKAFNSLLVTSIYFYSN